jgi:hypothetical protein
VRMLEHVPKQLTVLTEASQGPTLADAGLARQQVGMFWTGISPQTFEFQKWGTLIVGWNNACCAARTCRRES